MNCEQRNIPAECVDCREADCYNCDWAGERYAPNVREQLLMTRRLRERAIRRHQREIKAIDRRLAELERE